MSSASSAAYFSELSLFTEGSNCNNRINVGWKAPVYDQVTAERPGGQYSETSWPIQAYQFDLCSYQTPPSLQQNSYGFYRDKIIPGRNKLAGEDLRFKGINSATYSNGLRSGTFCFFIYILFYFILFFCTMRTRTCLGGWLVVQSSYAVEGAICIQVTKACFEFLFSRHSLCIRKIYTNCRILKYFDFIPTRKNEVHFLLFSLLFIFFHKLF